MLYSLIYIVRFLYRGVQDQLAQAAADEALALALSEAHHQEAEAMAYKVLPPAPALTPPLF